VSEGEITAPVDVDPYESPFPVPAIEGHPFPRDGAEARAIRRILEKADADSARDS
jgi:hypothetical protein